MSAGNIIREISENKITSSCVLARKIPLQKRLRRPPYVRIQL
jgi:hypothetical protein